MGGEHKLDFLERKKWKNSNSNFDDYRPPREFDHPFNIKPSSSVYGSSNEDWRYFTADSRGMTIENGPAPMAIMLSNPYDQRYGDDYAREIPVQDASLLLRSQSQEDRFINPLLTSATPHEQKQLSSTESTFGDVYMNPLYINQGERPQISGVNTNVHDISKPCQELRANKKSPIPASWSESAVENDTSNDLAIAKALSAEMVKDRNRFQFPLGNSLFGKPKQAKKLPFSEPVVDDHSLAIQMTAEELGVGVRGKKISDVEAEVKNRLSRLNLFPHKMKVNADLFPTEDSFTRNRRILRERLEQFHLREREMEGDGNCQFRAISDQLFGTPERFSEVRGHVVHQLMSNPDLYKAHVPEDYDSYVSKMQRNGEWGDHVTLQAAADFFGVRIYLITSYRDKYAIDIVPRNPDNPKLICLSFWAEVHYNSVYAME